VTRDGALPESIAVRAEPGRPRRRDGARNWTRARDLGTPQIWTESSHPPTGLDYIRHNTRATKADAENSERIRALHSGDGRPRVRRMIERPTTANQAIVTPRGPIDLH